MLTKAEGEELGFVVGPEFIVDTNNTGVFSQRHTAGRSHVVKPIVLGVMHDQIRHTCGFYVSLLGMAGRHIMAKVMSFKLVRTH